MDSQDQPSLDLIPHEIESSLIHQRAVDGYVNATAMCQACGKLFGHYRETIATKAYLEELSSVIGIPISELVISIKGGDPRLQGTWVHPDVAIHLGQWCSPKFAVAVAQWVREWMFGNAKPAGLPIHIQRYLANRSQIPPTHFSILNEMVFALIAPLEGAGYTLPDNMVPDISAGLMFSRWLRDEKGIDTNALPTYPHTYPDGRTFPARLYPNSVLADFRDYFHKTWLPQKAADYFADRDVKALPFLPKILPPPEA